MSEERTRYRLPAAKVKQRIEQTLARQKQMKFGLIDELSTLKTVLGNVAGINLHDTKGTLQAGQAEIEKAMRQIEAVQSTLGSSRGMINEMLGLLGDDESFHEFLNMLTIVFNEEEYFRFHEPTVRAVLELVQPDVFQAAFGDLPIERQVELTRSLE